MAIFASFSPGSQPRLRHFVTRSKAEAPPTLELIVNRLLDESREGSLNVRTFRRGESKGLPFVYGLRSVDEVVQEVHRHAASGLYTIVNETIDVEDGGVSGVRLGNVVEFAPGVTPRGVEKSDVAQMPLMLADSVLSTVYGFPVNIPGRSDQRIEFSVHPQTVGHRGSHLCVWEVEDVGLHSVDAEVSWPNDFSRLVGDKAFGLLIAHLLGARVAYSTVVGRRVAPFSFGERTGTGEWWIRTAPRQQVPGQFTTKRGWVDPFRLLQEEDPQGVIASVISQEGVAAVYSGATAPVPNDRDLVEGVAGLGDNFMLGAAEPERLPASVTDAVRAALDALKRAIGPVRVEWIFDGQDVWVAQVHRASPSSSATLNAGKVDRWVTFKASSGLEELRAILSSLEDGTGIIVDGRVGVTSHVGDLIRKHGVPARMRYVEL